jgi:hypothetical protein
MECLENWHRLLNRTLSWQHGGILLYVQSLLRLGVAILFFQSKRIGLDPSGDGPWRESGGQSSWSFSVPVHVIKIEIFLDQNFEIWVRNLRLCLGSDAWWSFIKVYWGVTLSDQSPPLSILEWRRLSSLRSRQTLIKLFHQICRFLQTFEWSCFFVFLIYIQNYFALMDQIRVVKLMVSGTDILRPHQP